MAISTNGWTIYAPEGTTIEQITEAFENDVDLWSKVTESKLYPHRGQSPREWVLAHNDQHIVWTTGWDAVNKKQRKKEWCAERLVCACGREVTKGHLSKHKATSTHIAALAAQASS